MKLLTKIPSKELEDIYFDVCLNSKAGCNVKVGDKNYNVVIDNGGDYIITEFTPDFELTEEEFKKIKK